MPVQSGSRKLEPIAPRSAFGEKMSVVPCVRIAPDAPAASAVRRIAPAFDGLLIRWGMTSRGTSFELWSSSLRLVCGREANKTMPWGAFTDEMEAKTDSWNRAARLVAHFWLFYKLQRRVWC